jgi:hypothetical protein
MATGKGPASKAGKELRSGKSTKEERTVSASDLSQAPRKPKKKYTPQTEGRPYAALRLQSAPPVTPPQSAADEKGKRAEPLLGFTPSPEPSSLSGVLFPWA